VTLPAPSAIAMPVAYSPIERAGPLRTSTSAPGSAARYGATVRHASGMLSLALAMTRGSASRGAGTSIASANGTRTTSVRKPPQSPPNAPNPNIAGSGTAAQLPVRPRRQRWHSPHEIWNGTTTRSPGATVFTWAADGEHLGDALVPHRDRHRQRRPAGRHRAVEVARRDRDRPHQRLPPVLEIRLRHVLPRQLAGSGQNQLAHRPDATGRRR
jgi:hypothetical protein